VEIGTIQAKSELGPEGQYSKQGLLIDKS